MPDIAGFKILRNIATGSVLNGGKFISYEPTTVQILVGNPQVSSDSKWAIKEEENGTYTIQNLSTFLTVTVEGSQAVATGDPAKIVYWDIVPEGKYYKIQAHNAGKVLGLHSFEPDTPVVVENYQGPEQEWELIDIPQPPPGN